MKSLLKHIVIRHKSLNVIISGMCSQSTQEKINNNEKYPPKLWRFQEEAKQFMAQRKQTNQLNIEPFKELIVDKDSENDIKEIIDYYNVRRTRTPFCPSIITKEDMIYMLNEISVFYRRKRHFDYLFVREFDIWRYNKKDEMKRVERKEKKRLEIENFGQIGCFDAQNNIQYGYWKNTLFTRYFNNGFKNYPLNYLRNATLFGQKIVIDCSFDNEMEEYETNSCGRQMFRIYYTNRHQSRDPFDLHYCSCDENSRVFKNFRKFLPKTDFKKQFINCHKESYSELFPNERLIYLTPDARTVMTEFDPNAVYILGSLVGKTCKLPFTLSKARREGLEHYRLPLHLYVKLAPNVKKVLSFQGVFKCLLEVKEHGDWKLAFERGIQEHKLADDQIHDK